MPLDGLRAWIGEVERKLGMRTRVFLVLAVIAIGGAGAAIYLAIDAQDNSVSESDVQALQQELEAWIGGGGASGGGAELAQVEAEVSALKVEVEKLQGKGGGSSGSGGKSGGAGSGGSGGGSSGSSGSGSESPSGTGKSGGESSNGSGTSSGPAVPDTSGHGGAAKLGELLQHAKEANEKAEGN